MAELTHETLPPAGPDYPLWPDPAAPGAPPVSERGRGTAGAPAAPRPRVLPEEHERDPGRAADES